jgi:hypothetical protein
MSSVEELKQALSKVADALVGHSLNTMDRWQEAGRTFASLTAGTDHSSASEIRAFIIETSGLAEEVVQREDTLHGLIEAYVQSL